MFFFCSGDQTGGIKHTALGFHLIKTLLYRCTTRKNFKRIPALRLCLVPRPLGRLQGGQLACFYDQEVQNARYTPSCPKAEQLRLLLQLLPSQSSHTWGSSDTRPAVHQRDGPETNSGKVFHVLEGCDDPQMFLWSHHHSWGEPTR